MSKSSAFTLVELVVVIAIISILAGSVLTVINPASKRQDARDAVRKSDLAVISSAIENYYADNNIYPNANTLDCLYDILDGPVSSFGGCPNGPKVYLNTKPADPSSGTSKYCYTNPTQQRFNLCAKLERGQEELHGATNCSPTGSGTGGVYCLTNPF